MKKTLFLFVFQLLVVGAFAQSHTIHNNTTTVLITPGGISSSHISGTPTTNTNLSLGKDALPLAPLSATQNLFNTAIGHQTLLSNASGSNNVALGYNVLRSLNDGNRNIGVGNNALQNNNGGTSNVSIGFDALKANVVLSSLIAIGDSSMQALTGGLGNSISIGVNAMKNKIRASENIVIGKDALADSPFYSLGNIAIGNNVLRKHIGDLSIFTNNIALGNNTLRNSTINWNSTIIGHNSFLNQNSNIGNVALGNLIFSNALSTGGNNTIIGYGAMANVAGVASNNVVIGYEAARDFAPFSNGLVISNHATNTPLIGGHWAFSGNKVGINRLFTSIATDANTFQVAGKLGISDQLNFGLDANSGFSFIKNSGVAAAGNMEFSTNATIRMEINAAGLVKLTNVPTYATDALAGAGGLTAGQIYKTAGGQLMIKL